MNVHVILGTISKKPRIVTAESKKPFLIMEIVDKVDPNQAQENKWNVLRYGELEKLHEIVKALALGDMVFIHGSGSFNRAGYYNIIAKEILSLEIKSKPPELEVSGDADALYGFLEQEMFRAGEDEV